MINRLVTDWHIPLLTSNTNIPASTEEIMRNSAGQDLWSDTQANSTCQGLLCGQQRNIMQPPHLEFKVILEENDTGERCACI